MPAQAGNGFALHNFIAPVSTAACLHLNLATPDMLAQELPCHHAIPSSSMVNEFHRYFR